MSSTFYFSTFFSKSPQGVPWQSPVHSTSKKRKRQASADFTEKHEGCVASVETDSETPRCQGSPSRISSVQIGEAIPAQNLSIAQDRDKCFVAGSYSPRELTQELASFNPPLIFPDSVRRTNTLKYHQSGLKQRHLAVLTTIMHKFLARGDYIRAGRAWGMLLRAEVKGHPPNIRSNGLWGLGAELLSYRGVQLRQLQNPPKNDLEDFANPRFAERASHYSTNIDQAQFSREGFEGAKAYYDRLILQHPWRKWLPDALSSLYFYPVMFGLWISFVQDQHLTALARLSQGLENWSDSDTVSECTDEEWKSIKKQSIYDSSFKASKAIVQRLDELIVSFPYSDSVTLWRLRAMVALWMGDLSTAEAGLDEQDSYELQENGSPELSQQDDESIEKRSRLRLARDNRRHRNEERKSYLERAKKAFDTANQLKENVVNRDQASGLMEVL